MIIEKVVVITTNWPAKSASPSNCWAKVNEFTEAGVAKIESNKINSKPLKPRRIEMVIPTRGTIINLKRVPTTNSFKFFLTEV